MVSLESGAAYKARGMGSGNFTARFVVSQRDLWFRSAICGEVGGRVVRFAAGLARLAALNAGLMEPAGGMVVMQRGSRWAEGQFALMRFL